MPSLSGPFATGVPENFPAILDDKGNVDPGKITGFLNFGKRDVAQAAQIPTSKVRWDARMPADLRQRLLMWARLLALVAEFFNGDAEKTATWFQTKSDYLGGWEPRDYIRFGRAAKLEQIIRHALAENQTSK
jgi:hypothetical protein